MEELNSLFLKDDMVLYVENSKYGTKKLLKPMNELARSQNIRISIPKNKNQYTKYIIYKI